MHVTATNVQFPTTDDFFAKNSDFDHSKLPTSIEGMVDLFGHVPEHMRDTDVDLGCGSDLLKTSSQRTSGTLLGLIKPLSNYQLPNDHLFSVCCGSGLTGVTLG